MASNYNQKSESCYMLVYTLFNVTTHLLKAFSFQIYFSACTWTHCYLHLPLYCYNFASSFSKLYIIT